ncbi:FAD-dependent monooxygenase [Roseivivax isoporae]|uniref:Salicylate 1-monooxygenase n=1 Tax=Roseivivax isoporae LMG 25204 TaxID=1449351 RepID=X7F8Z1_9RHOB|nr:FAD-dependent monooxygenase [Roseivivax isoporae]ETX29198.1 Salicylate 1-monooxygenase [Roseivivax isoporae LMG 25204]
MKVIIAGGGIGGLTAALYLHKHGVSCQVFEKVPEILQLGVGITMLPHAIRAMNELGLMERLDELGVRTDRMIFRTRGGQEVWNAPRGLAAGYDVPQITAHRADIHQVLLDAVTERLPAGALTLDAAFEAVEDTGEGVHVTLRRGDGTTFTAEGDVLIGADGIHSAVRRLLNPDEGAPRWSGLMLWRGALDWPKVLDGHTIINSGGIGRKFIFYPIGPGKTPGTQLMNWACVVRQAEPGAPAPGREDWNREAQAEVLHPILADFDVPETDIRAMVDATPVFWDFPMCDRDPLKTWTRGRVTLLGDAAHPMYPFGANGSAQAILDARALGRLCGAGGDPAAILQAYEAERLGPVNEVVAGNRTGGPERVIDEVEARIAHMPGQRFSDLETILPFKERDAIVNGYSRLAGFATEQVR